MPRNSALQAVADNQKAAARAVEKKQRTPLSSLEEGEGAKKLPPSQAARLGKYRVCGYVPMEAKSSLMLCIAKNPEAKIQELLAEALDLLFAKYGVPETARSSD